MTTITTRIAETLRAIDLRSALNSAWAYGAACALQARTLDVGATYEASRGYEEGARYLTDGPDVYMAVVETGSCSMDRERWEEAETCGHRHRTIEAARKCLGLKQRYYCRHGRIAHTQRCTHCLGSRAHADSCSARWYNGIIHNQHGERA